MERIVPIYDPIIDSSKPTVIGGTLADLVASILSGLVAIVSLGYSILFFTRFLENDTHLWGIISAFILCFGVGAFAYIPAGITSVIAWRAYKTGASKTRCLWALFFVLPWFMLSLCLVFISDLSKIYAILICVTAALLLAWAVISWLQARSVTA